VTFVLADWILRIAMATVIIWRKRSPSGALAWLVVVAFVPLIGALLYFLVGENRLGWRRLSRHQSVVQRADFQHSDPGRFSSVWQPRLSEIQGVISGRRQSGETAHAASLASSLAILR
jgi:hypothetical protein